MDLEDVANQAEEYAEGVEDEQPRKRKERADKGKSRKRATPKNQLKLELWEADRITDLLQLGLLGRYGAITQAPDNKEREHLAHVLKKLGTVPPFSFVQAVMRRLVPVTSPEVKPGRSTFGDLSRYLWGWHTKNPELYVLILEGEQIYIPFVTSPPPGMNGGGPPPSKEELQDQVGQEITDEQYQQFLATNYGGG